MVAQHVRIWRATARVRAAVHKEPIEGRVDEDEREIVPHRGARDALRLEVEAAVARRSERASLGCDGCESDSHGSSSAQALVDAVGDRPEDVPPRVCGRDGAV
eukprot:4435734-Prymnesium_polylepis.2